MLAMVEGTEVLGGPLFWLIVGLVGQTMFFGRFLAQWIAGARVGSPRIRCTGAATCAMP